MTAAGAGGKEQKMLRTAEATLDVIHRHGINGLSFARVARAAEVSRPWLYKYIGNTDRALLEFATDTFGTLYTRLNGDDSPTTGKEWIQHTMDRFGRFLDSAVRHPSVLPLYLRYRGTKTPVGERVRVIESKYIEKQITDLERSFGLSKHEARLAAEILLAIRVGLAHRWCDAEVRARVNKKELLLYLRLTLKALLRSNTAKRAAR